MPTIQSCLPIYVSGATQGMDELEQAFFTSAARALASPLIRQAGERAYQAQGKGERGLDDADHQPHIRLNQLVSHFPCCLKQLSNLCRSRRARLFWVQLALQRCINITVSVNLDGDSTGVRGG